MVSFLSRVLHRWSVVLAVTGTAAIVTVGWVSTGGGAAGAALAYLAAAGVAAWVAALGLWAAAGMLRERA